jgi:hypothetical protein
MHSSAAHTEEEKGGEKRTKKREESRGECTSGVEACRYMKARIR